MKPNKPVILAFDKMTVRRVDTDGRLFVKTSHITRADVNPYYGREIPTWDELGLDPDRVYQVFRPPEELQKGAHTFNTLPILAIHTHVTAENPQKEEIIGSTGSNAVFDGTWLDNALGFWDAQYIDKIDDDSQRELSCSYRYIPIIENGSYNGSPYDLKMTAIEGNHVALVVEGRAGPEVMVADTQIHPPQKAHTVKLNPKQKAALKARMPKLKVAMDEGLDTEAVENALEEALEEVQALGEPETTDDEEGTLLEKLKKLIEGAGSTGASDEEKKPADDEAAKRAEEARKADEAKNAGAMDAKIKAAADGARVSIESRFRAAQKVEPITGKLDAMAFDSADAIFAHALKVGGMEPEKHDAAAYSGIVDVLLTKRAEPTPHGAQDSAANGELLKMFPALAKINHA
ncbi:DUF2213 domain-containing protein [Paraburkholderia bannensis]|uniref:DUF2213 domain-containing protein n=1 Tax=Paraburkholderia bannensis TaxID=765414 RepID=UPI0004876736|nr:DUF2213 domain-containing protein [Paraburkholderia bannensis]